MKKTIIMILLSSVILNPVAAADSALKVKAGEAVPKQYDQGTLLDPGQASKIKQQLQDADDCTKENKSYQKSVELYKSNETAYQDENTLLLNRNLSLSKSLNDAKETSDLTKILYFGLGVVITGGAFYGASKLVK
jgi:hypothetical protein